MDTTYWIYYKLTEHTNDVPAMKFVGKADSVANCERLVIKHAREHKLDLRNYLAAPEPGIIMHPAMIKACEKQWAEEDKVDNGKESTRSESGG